MGGEREVRGKWRVGGEGGECKLEKTFKLPIFLSKERLYSSYFNVFIKVPRTTNNDFLGWK